MTNRKQVALTRLAAVGMMLLSAQAARAVEVKVIAVSESAAKATDCRRMLVGPRVNQSDPHSCAYRKPHPHPMARLRPRQVHGKAMLSAIGGPESLVEIALLSLFPVLWRDHLLDVARG
jgi:hypothetical protein